MSDITSLIAQVNAITQPTLTIAITRRIHANGLQWAAQVTPADGETYETEVYVEPWVHEPAKAMAYDVLRRHQERGKSGI